MAIDTRLTVRKLMAQHPELAKVLGWYGVDLDDSDFDLSLVALADAYDLDLEDVVAELESSGAEDDWDDDDDDEADQNSDELEWN